MKIKALFYMVSFCFYSTTMLGQTYESSLWKSMKTSGEVELYGSYRDFTLMNNNVTDEGNYTLYSGKILLMNSSYVWHPNFMTLDAKIIYNPGAGNDVSIILPDAAVKNYSNVYSLETKFLRKQKLSFGSFFNFNNSYYSKENLSEFKNKIYNWGADLNYKNKFFPMEFNFKRVNDFEENKIIDRQIDNERTEFELQIKNNINNWSESELTASSKESKHEMNNVYRREIRYDNINLNNRIYFKNNRNNNLFTRVSEQRSSGFFNFDRFNIIQTLSLSFNTNLSLTGSYNFSKGKQDDVKIKTNYYNTELRYNIYKSLRSRFIFKHFENKLGAVRRNYNLIAAGFNYSKKIPLKGRLAINYYYSKNFETGFQPAETNTLLQSFFISDDSLNFIEDSNVVIESIQITDQSGSYLFIENVDYIIIDIDGLIEIQRLPGGNIENNSTVFLTYVSNNPGDYSFDFEYTSFDAHVFLYNELIELYYKSSKQNFHNVFVNETFNLREFNSNNYGFNINWRFLSLGYSFTDLQSNISPFTNDTFFISLKGAHQKIRYSLGANYNKINFSDLNNETDLYKTISGQMSYQLSRNDLINFKINYRSIEGTGIDLNLFTGSLMYSKKYRKLEFNIMADYYDKLFLQETNYKYLGIRMSIIRKF